MKGIKMDGARDTTADADIKCIQKKNIYKKKKEKLWKMNEIEEYWIIISNIKKTGVQDWDGLDKLQEQKRTASPLRYSIYIIWQSYGEVVPNYWFAELSVGISFFTVKCLTTDVSENPMWRKELFFFHT